MIIIIGPGDGVVVGFGVVVVVSGGGQGQLVFVHSSYEPVENPPPVEISPNPPLRSPSFASSTGT